MSEKLRPILAREVRLVLQDHRHMVEKGGDPRATMAVMISHPDLAGPRILLGNDEMMELLLLLLTEGI